MGHPTCLDSLNHVATSGTLTTFDRVLAHDLNLFRQQVEEDPTGGKFSAAGGTLNSAPHKLEDTVHFHVGDLVKALGRAALQPGGQEALLYGTLGGAIGMGSNPFAPFVAHSGP